MEGLAQAIQVIQQTACEAKAAQILDVKDPDRYHVRLGQELVEISKPAATREHRVFDMPSFCGAVDRFGDGTATVWHSHQAVTATLSDGTRRDWLSLALNESDQFRALKEADEKLLDQRTFCSMLKLKLGIDETFIGQFRRLDWQHEKNINQTSARGQDRMGASISDEVNGVDDLADEIVLEIPVYDLANLPFRYKIACHIEIDAAQQKLAIVAKPDAIKSAVDQAQEDICHLLDNGLNNDDSERVTPIFYGSPT